MAEARRNGAGLESEWERAWSDHYPQASSAPPNDGARPGAPHRSRLKHLLLTTSVLGITVSSIAIAGEDSTDPRLTAARGEGDALRLGERNPGSGESTRETAVVANAGNGGLVLRPSNTAKGGRAISATCDNDGVTEEDGCAVYVNKGTGAAASFRTNGSVPFAIRSSNNGLVANLNADMVDGKHATDFLARSESSAFLGATAKAADADALDGRDSNTFLGVNGKAADANTLDGMDSTEYLGSTAKAADAHLLDGVESDDFARVSGIVNGANGAPLSTGITAVRNGEGDYSVTINDGTFANSGSSCSLLRPVVSPVGNEFHAAVWNEAGCKIGGGGEFDVLTFDATGAAEDATFGFIVDVVP
jgi:hypothetical protein